MVDGVDRYLEKVMDTYLAERYPDVHIQERNIQLDYIHILIEIPPEYSVAKVIQDIKSNTSLKLRKKFEYLGRGNKPVWSIGYFVSTVGMNEGVIRKYIRNQEKEDKGHEVYLEDETTDVA